jgi:hypothetical protein
MDKAPYHYDQAERCLELGRHLSDPLGASLTLAAAARHFERAAQLENARPPAGPSAIVVRGGNAA